MSERNPYDARRHERDRQENQLLRPEDFPTPRIALKNHLTLADVEWFAAEQADAANGAAAELHDALDSTPEAEWHEIFAQLDDQLVEWRYQLAVAQGVPQAERFRTPITDDSPNIDPVGASVGFWHKGYEWDESLGRHAGGEETPASQLVAEVGEWVNERFDEEDNAGDLLQNLVMLPSGILVNGNSLLRGEAAHEQNRIGIERAKARGIDTSRFDVNGDFIYVKTGTEADRAAIRQAMYEYVAQLESAHRRGESITVAQWAEVAYLLYQSPMTKKGSDAVNRVYLMTLASRWLNPMPTMPEDIDWRAYVRGQGRFVEEMVAGQAVIPEY